jgi:peroxiredoxin
MSFPRFLSLLILAALLSAGLLAGCSRSEPGTTLPALNADGGTRTVARLPDGMGGLQPGDTPPPFTLNDVAGNPVSLADFAGQPVMLNFWATWCAPCRFEMPDMQAAAERHADQGFVILALNQAESADKIIPFYESLGLTFPALLDDKTTVSAQYGARNVLPSSFFIHPDGTIAAVHRGGLTATQLDRYLELILP